MIEFERSVGCKAQDKVQINPDALTQLKPTIIIKTMYHEVSEDDVKSIPRCDKKSEGSQDKALYMLTMILW